ncbi:MAG: hypothetical protein RMJ89_07910 [Flammeovirgaceae bacterium]|nr:hypothetical protein [Flammeovirgaceae bacterium]
MKTFIKYTGIALTAVFLGIAAFNIYSEYTKKTQAKPLQETELLVYSRLFNKGNQLLTSNSIVAWIDTFIF